ncbi:MAG: pantothenate kinase [Treponema sp.]|jgi:type II pantothenate kinase|nr:pantothenate kinase [Treponema sp.]
MIIGIDIGSTTTKTVSVEDGVLVRKIKTRAQDAVTSAAGAFGKLLIENDIEITGVSGIAVTGAGASKLKNNLFGIPTQRVDEIKAIGTGGLFLAETYCAVKPRTDRIVIANVGTGTAILQAGKDGIAHLGGSGVGGGTIYGLAKKLLPTADFSGIMELAKDGKLNQVDLLLEDITDTEISFLPRESTAANFGKMLDSALNSDIALGILNMVYQVIGMISVFAARSVGVDRVIVTGNGSNNPVGKQVLRIINEMYGIRFEYPPDAEYTTAVGAALSWRNQGGAERRSCSNAPSVNSA